MSAARDRADLDRAALDPAAAADKLETAYRSGAAIEQFGDGLTLDQAYRIQAELRRRSAARGEAYAGPKLGFTSEAKMAQMGISDVIVGYLTRDMEVPDGGTLSLRGLVHPRVEPEIAFRLGRAVDPADGYAALVEAVDAVAPALEVIDSRYRDFRFSLPDVVADNTSACRYVVGPWRDVAPDLQRTGLNPHRLNPRSLNHRRVDLQVDGATVQEGSTAAILGDPLRSLEQLATMAARHGFPLPAGAVVLAGAATAAVYLEPGTTITGSVEGLGSVELRIEGDNP